MSVRMVDSQANTLILITSTPSRQLVTTLSEMHTKCMLNSNLLWPNMTYASREAMPKQHLRKEHGFPPRCYCILRLLSWSPQSGLRFGNNISIMMSSATVVEIVTTKGDPSPLTTPTAENRDTLDLRVPQPALPSSSNHEPEQSLSEDRRQGQSPSNHGPSEEPRAGADQ